MVLLFIACKRPSSYCHCTVTCDWPSIGPPRDWCPCLFSVFHVSLSLLFPFSCVSSILNSVLPFDYSFLYSSGSREIEKHRVRPCRLIAWHSTWVCRVEGSSVRLLFLPRHTTTSGPDGKTLHLPGHWPWRLPETAIRWSGSRDGEPPIVQPLSLVPSVNPLLTGPLAPHLPLKGKANRRTGTIGRVCTHAWGPLSPSMTSLGRTL